MSRPLIVYKVLTGQELIELERDGRIDGTRDDLRDGYIHLSTAEQLTETVDRHCADLPDPQVVAIDVTAQGDRLRWERSRHDELFPHLYGPLLLETVVAYGPLARDEDGSVRLPVTG